MGKKKERKEATSKVFCPVCLSDNLDEISSRMKKCRSCGFIWNHEVSDRDNLLLIVEHQTKRENANPQTPIKEQVKKRKAS